MTTFAELGVRARTLEPLTRQNIREPLAVQAAAILSGSVPTIRFVPWVTVIGRSVVVLSVRHGVPSAVVSSWIPPESVRTQTAWVMS